MNDYAATLPPASALLLQLKDATTRGVAPLMKAADRPADTISATSSSRVLFHLLPAHEHPLNRVQLAASPTTINNARRISARRRVAS